ncbi:hypothetical protein NDU88_000552 [Pleurodeles waltl]|uniref:Uncharacterized protein n=1 Tax=Pleurodeles waltl TaxID=8319 RepID=A0AAV7R7L2_PLEWA|nr:hypothetical protein NDU88_000552 [Pleurodeles waltl]
MSGSCAPTRAPWRCSALSCTAACQAAVPQRGHPGAAPLSPALSHVRQLCPNAGTLALLRSLLHCCMSGSCAPTRAPWCCSALSCTAACQAAVPQRGHPGAALLSPALSHVRQLCPNAGTLALLCSLLHCPMSGSCAPTRAPRRCSALSCTAACQAAVPQRGHPGAALLSPALLHVTQLCPNAGTLALLCSLLHCHMSERCAPTRAPCAAPLSPALSHVRQLCPNAGTEALLRSLLHCCMSGSCAPTRAPWCCSALSCTVTRQAAVPQCGHPGAAPLSPALSHVRQLCPNAGTLALLCSLLHSQAAMPQRWHPGAAPLSPALSHVRQLCPNAGTLALLCSLLHCRMSDSCAPTQVPWRCSAVSCTVACQAAVPQHGHPGAALLSPALLHVTQLCPNAGTLVLLCSLLHCCMSRSCAPTRAPWRCSARSCTVTCQRDVPQRGHPGAALLAPALSHARQLCPNTGTLALLRSLLHCQAAMPQHGHPGAALLAPALSGSYAPTRAPWRCSARSCTVTSQAAVPQRGHPGAALLAPALSHVREMCPNSGTLALLCSLLHCRMPDSCAPTRAPWRCSALSCTVRQLCPNTGTLALLCSLLHCQAAMLQHGHPGAAPISPALSHVRQLCPNAGTLALLCSLLHCHMSERCATTRAPWRCSALSCTVRQLCPNTGTLALLCSLLHCQAAMLQHGHPGAALLAPALSHVRQLCPNTGTLALLCSLLHCPTSGSCAPTRAPLRCSARSCTVPPQAAIPQCRHSGAALLSPALSHIRQLCPNAGTHAS